MIGEQHCSLPGRRITTSSPGTSSVALLDGVFKFLPSRAMPRHRERGRAGEAMSRAHAIITELLTHRSTTSTTPSCAPNLVAVYDYCAQSRITYANRHNDTKAIEDVIRVMTPIREAFTIAVSSLAQPPLERTGSIG